MVTAAPVDVRAADPQTTPLVLDSPHSGSDYPDDFRPACGPGQFRRAEDMDVDVLFGAAVEVGAVLVAARFPRIYCDANRAVDDLDPTAIVGDAGMPLNPTAKARLGKGVIWQAVPPQGAALYAEPLDAVVVRQRLDTCWHPYHATLGRVLDDTHARFGRVFHVDCHSMQAVSSVMHEEGAGRPRADIVLSDREGATCAPAFLEAARSLLEAEGFEVAVNNPYKGAEIVRRYGRPAEGRHSLQLELNRRLYMDEMLLQRTSDFGATKDKLTRFLGGLAAAVHAL